MGWLKPGMVVLHVCFMTGAGNIAPLLKKSSPGSRSRNGDSPLPQSPNLGNAYAERWVRTVKQQCLSKFLIVGEPMLRNLLTEYFWLFITRRETTRGFRQHDPISKAGNRKHPNPSGRIIKQTRLGLLNYLTIENHFYARQTKRKIAI